MDDTDDLIVNLKSIANTHINDKMYISGRYIVRDERMLQSLIRYITGDCRERVVGFLEKMMPEIERRLNGDPGWKRDKMIEIMPAVINGMKNMRFTYCHDRIIIFRLENMIDTLQNMLESMEEAT